jgi:hypothetical protein
MAVFNAFDRETLTVGTTPVGFDVSKILPGGGDPARQAQIVIRSGGPINFTLDGTTVTNTAGSGPWVEGTSFTVTGVSNVVNFQAIRDSTAASNAILEIEYLR